MIKVDRSRVPMPEDLRTDVDSAGKLEIEEAKKFFQKKVLARQAAARKLPDVASKIQKKKKTKKKSKKPESFEFKVYKEAKPALKELFNDKCGYCEIDYGGAASDVEHFRPKGEVVYEDQGGVRTYPEGYYWLAADWDNLIYSCQHCNRGETHFHQERAGAPLVRRVSGKGNYFPLRDESKRLKPCDPVDGEESFRLLLDPCRDEPQHHLQFRADGFVTAKIVDDRPSLLGSASIRFYGLSRVELIGRRKDIANKLLFNLARLSEALVELQAQPSAARRLVVVDTLKHIRTEYLARHKPFLGMAWTLFRQRINVGEIYAATRVTPQHHVVVEPDQQD